MLRLTRGIDLFYKASDEELVLGGGRSLSLAQVPLRLWVTLEGEVLEGQGFLVHVADIDAALRAGLGGGGFRKMRK